MKIVNGIHIRCFLSKTRKKVIIVMPIRSCPLMCASETNPTVYLILAAVAVDTQNDCGAVSITMN